MGWEAVASLTGDQGPEGPTGPQGPAGAAGATGPAGADGKSIEFTATVDTYGDLPTDLDAGDAGKGYYVEADGQLYPWSGTAFPAEGAGIEVQGPEGPQGEPGVQGEVGPAGPTGSTGTTGSTGPAGSTGAAGADGDDGLRGTQIYTGTGGPGTVPGSAVGDLYIDTTAGAVTLYKLN
jgi:hypothetical protein